MILNHNQIKERMKGTFIEFLNIDFIESEQEKELEATMLIRQDLLQTSGVLHGGVTIAFAETLAGVASNNICPEEEFAFGIQISANHVSHGEIGDTVKGKATPVHIGRTTHVWNVDIYSEKSGKLVSSVRATNIVIKRK
ncbi:PaaI family thioesterase [Dysgonomonas sp. 25]|uniref:PaaI family thioesterase n=1 Tax=Dysgonomonas sp. 25 TaxID=2302933 RepID=UPI0013D0B77E|nr:PaaI family thioesterase [Dysgonomonas sp. 25]NDV68263.1 PaaI family thioesterase [Dysgonomonas sp. 25]